jgi:hypothetical protein
VVDYWILGKKANGPAEEIAGDTPPNKPGAQGEDSHND